MDFIQANKAAFLACMRETRSIKSALMRGYINIEEFDRACRRVGVATFPELFRDTPNVVGGGSYVSWAMACVLSFVSPTWAGLEDDEDRPFKRSLKWMGEYLPASVAYYDRSVDGSAGMFLGGEGIREDAWMKLEPNQAWGAALMTLPWAEVIAQREWRRSAKADDEAVLTRRRVMDYLHMDRVFDLLSADERAFVDDWLAEKFSFTSLPGLKSRMS